mgnify:FL=1
MFLTSQTVKHEPALHHWYTGDTRLPPCVLILRVIAATYPSQQTKKSMLWHNKRCDATSCSGQMWIEICKSLRLSSEALCLVNLIVLMLRAYLQRPHVIINPCFTL